MSAVRVSSRLADPKAEMSSGDRSEKKQLGKKALLGPIIIGLGGSAVLAALGFWQLDRLQWKEALIASIEERMFAAPGSLPLQIDPETLDYMPVAVQGAFDPAARINFLSSKTPFGPGYDIISAFETEDGRRILIDRGYVQMKDQAALKAPEGSQSVAGLLRWPDDKNSFVPDPDRTRMEWYSRDVASMAAALQTEPVLLVAAPADPDTKTADQSRWPAPRPQRITLPNHHFQYALTWFALAVVWLAMSLGWTIKLRRGTS